MKRPLSMTGFGRGEKTGSGRSWVVEIRSVNHRYLDIKSKIPWKYAQLEEKIKTEIGAYHGRGHIDLVLGVSGAGADGVRLQANIPLAGEYYRCLQQLRDELGVAGDADLAMVASFRDVIVPATDDVIQEDLEELWPDIREALVAALENGLAMRENEGQSLKRDLVERLAGFTTIIAEVESAVPDVNRKRQESLLARLDTILSNAGIDPVRLAQEAAILVDKSDITEELVRIRSHISQFESILDSGEPVGRRLDFLVQEFLREINTMASKISDAAVAHRIVDLKNELEKMREQIQNLE